MADVTCSICVEPMTLECNLAAPPCSHLFHTICIIKRFKKYPDEILSPGFFTVRMYIRSTCKDRPFTEAKLLPEKIVCFQCGESINQIFRMLFKTADEIKNFAERMKKIGAGMCDQNARYSHSSNENNKSSKEFEINFQNLNLENWSKDLLGSPELDLIIQTNGNRKIKTDDLVVASSVASHDVKKPNNSKELEELEIKSNWKRGMKNHAHACHSNSTSSNNAAANSLKRGPQVLIKSINGIVTITPVPGTGTENSAEMVQQQQQTPVHAGHTHSSQPHSGHVPAAQANAGHAQAGHDEACQFQRSYPQAVHDKFEYIDSEEIVY